MSYQGHCNCETFSVNYFVNEDELTVNDPNATLKMYEDKKSLTSNIMERYFCSRYGSPVYTKTPKAPGKIFLKAVLFDTVSVPTTEVFINKQYQWVTIEQGEKQA
ncbi:hypothetical protein N7537_010275 [Penicillium hordei]|uniref:CENP-V/GFA domain-containing protein n=1 Tax=Penicillium hordei TaxID=40994 RepID=A0AAD6GVJ0_9EURO|nr:uncharacterized protein N7537_010275 [Penicillium hordei]KAJ5593371.1 hypothetical protein N7537_010275 [Penicillium hordei]